MEKRAREKERASDREREREREGGGVSLLGFYNVLVCFI